MSTPKEELVSRWASDEDAEAMARSFDNREELDADDVAYLNDLDNEHDEA